MHASPWHDSVNILTILVLAESGGVSSSKSYKYGIPFALRVPRFKRLDLRGGASQSESVSEILDSSQAANATSSMNDFSGLRLTEEQCVWDWATGPGRWADEFMVTVFRNRKTAVAVEIVHQEHEGCVGFFRFLSSEIFLIEPECMLWENMTDSCPGYSSFVNAHYTGDFFGAPHIYHQLAKANIATPAHSERNGTFAVGNWTAVLRNECVILQHPRCFPARIVLTSTGFIYQGAENWEEFFPEPPKGIIVSDDNPPRHVDLREARRAIAQALHEAAPAEDEDPSSPEEEAQHASSGGRVGGECHAAAPQRSPELQVGREGPASSD